MGVSTTRLVVLLFVLNYGLQLVIDGALGGTPTSTHDTYTTELEGYAGSLSEEQPQQTPASYLSQNIFGDTVTQGKQIFRFLINGLNPWPFGNMEFETQLESMAAIGLLFFRSLTFLITGVETYNFLVNKKWI